MRDLETSIVLEDTTTPERHLTARDELRQVQAALDRMPERRREIVMLRKLEGLSQKEIAARLGVSVSTVEKQLADGMRFLVGWMLNAGEGAPDLKTKAREAKQ